MSPPDASRLASLSSAAWGALGARLRAIGLSAQAVDPILRTGQNLPPRSRGAIRAWHLRRGADAAAYAMRMLCFGDPVTVAEAREALGELFDPLLDAGLIAPAAGDRIVSPFELSLSAGLYIFSDDLTHGGEAVMGPSGTTKLLCRAALPQQAVKRALDVGCGAGTGALVLARRAEHVVGTDISERAVLFSRVNAAINGITNVDFRVGDLFAPVTGETFDLILSQPPFVPMPRGAETATWLHGGPRGDELSLRLLGELAPYLAAGGRAVLLVEWGSKGDDDLGARARAAIAPASDLSLLVLQSQMVGLDDHAVGYAATLHPQLDAQFDAEVLLRREHLQGLGIDGLTLTVTVVQRGAGPAWTHVLPVGPVGAAAFTSARIDRLVAAHAVAADPRRLLAASLRVPAGTTFAEEQDGPGAHVPSSLGARFSPEALILPAQLTPQMLWLLTFIHESVSVHEGLEKLAKTLEAPLPAVMQEYLLVVHGALLSGMLELEGPGEPETPGEG